MLTVVLAAAILSGCVTTGTSPKKIKDGEAISLDFNGTDKKVITIADFVDEGKATDIVYAVKADNDKAAVSAIAEGKFTITAKKVGSAVVTLEASVAEEVKVTITWAVTIVDTTPAPEPAKKADGIEISLDVYDNPTETIGIADYIDEQGATGVTYTAESLDAFVTVSDIADGEFTITAVGAGETMIILKALMASVAKVQINFTVIAEDSTPVAREDMGEYGETLLAFTDISDIHFDGASQDAVTPSKVQRYTCALKEGNRLTGNRLDASICCGDISEGYPSNLDWAVNLTKQYGGKAGKVPFISAYGNHEGIGKQGQFQSKLGYKPDSVHVVNGFTFITTNIDQGYDSDSTYSYNPMTTEFVKAELEKAVAKDPTKPIFVLAHVPIKGSSTTGQKRLRDVIKNFPQVYVLSGHSHTTPSGASAFYENEFHEFEQGTLQNGPFAIIRVTTLNYVLVDVRNAPANANGTSTVINNPSPLKALDMNAFLRSKGVNIPAA